MPSNAAIPISRSDALARLAHVFHYDLGSFLGFTATISRPSFITGENRKRINRGKGVEYEALHLPALDLDLVIVTLAPGSGFKDALTHEGIDVLYVLEGDVMLVLNDVDYPMTAGDCTIFAAGFPHRLAQRLKATGYGDIRYHRENVMTQNVQTDELDVTMTIERWPFLASAADYRLYL